MSKIFIHNKYRKIYIQIIKKAKSEDRIKLPLDHPDYTYYENHHIIPKSLSGNNKQINLVLLTGKEHYMAHRLLIKFTKEKFRSKMVFAMHRMIHGVKNNRYYPCSGIYAQIRIEHAKLMSIQNTGIKQSVETCKKKSLAQKGKIVSNITRKKIGDIHRGKKTKPESNAKRLATIESNGGYSPSEKTRKAIGDANRGKEVSIETRKKTSDALKGNQNAKGFKHSQETLELMSQKKREWWAKKKATDANNK